MRAAIRWVPVLVVIVVILWDQSYVGRREVVESSRRACQRGQRDRLAQAEAWYSAYLARRDQAAATPPGPLRAQYKISARTYFNSAWTLNHHNAPANSVTWPPGSRHHPLGLGTVACSKAYPAASPFSFGR